MTDIKSHIAYPLFKRGIFIKLNIKTIKDLKVISIDKSKFILSDKDKEESYNAIEKILIPKQISMNMLHLKMYSLGNLDKHGFKTDFGTFVPFTALKQWYAKNEEFRNLFFDQLNYIFLNYDRIVSEIKLEHTKFAKKIWAMSHSESVPPTESFISEVVNEISSFIPSKTDIISKSSFDISFYPASIDFSLDANVDQETNDILNKILYDRSHILDSFYADTVLVFKEKLKQRFFEILDMCEHNLKIKKPLIRRKTQLNLVKIIKFFELFDFYEDHETQNLIKELKFETYKPIEILDQQKVKNLIINIIETQDKKIKF